MHLLPSSSSSSRLRLLSLALLLHVSFGVAAVDPLYAVCSTSRNYTANDGFSDNLRQLMFMLATKSSPIGFALGSVGQGGARANGLALCRGDIKSTACTTCVRTAGARVRDLCPNNKDGIIWFDECMLRYSDVEFFGEIDFDHRFYMWNRENVSDAVMFDGKVENLMNRLKQKAYISPLLFATGEMEIGESQELYGLVQCTKDLSGGDCKKCLEAVIGELPSCCDGKRGGRVVGGSCNIRYELYPFFDA
ncbi:antimicrobial ginkbilobin-2-like protein [Musa acuminata AAA Group]|uniref:antimicrobial ginkbilobin-2-like protein n=1 Tax=Musa acuminata AAA Group TaxID=214697 RepID=UPI0031DFCA97